MLQITDIILIALFIEAFVSAIKPIWSKEGERLPASAYVSMSLGILMAVACQINMLAYVMDAKYPEWVNYVFYVMTGVAIGRGTNFLYDLWQKFKEFTEGNILTTPAMTGYLADDYDLEVAHWNLEKIKSFCLLNDIDCTGCVTREDYIAAIERGGSDVPPRDGDAE